MYFELAVYGDGGNPFCFFNGLIWLLLFYVFVALQCQIFVVFVGFEELGAHLLKSVPVVD